MKEIWHSLSPGEVLEKLEVDEERGLSKEEVEKRRERWGENRIREGKSPSVFDIFLRQFKSPLVYVLLAVFFAVLILEKGTKSYFEAGFVLIAVLINAFFGTWEEFKAEKTFERLKDILSIKAIVLRDGRKKEVDQNELVPGDVIFLDAGAKVPADARLISSSELKVSEAVLTGEWLPVKKDPASVSEETVLGERSSMVHGGSLVEGGEAKAVVTATGERTEMGKISVLLEETEEEKSPLQKKMASFLRRWGGAIIFLSLLIFGAGLSQGIDPVEIFETSAAVAVGGIPEALPVVMTLTLAIGMERLARKKGLIKRLDSVETLGSTSVICCDKTRTLTLGKMQAEKIIALKEEFEIKQREDPVFDLALRCTSLANDAFVENPEEDYKKWKVRGEPTDRALLLTSTLAGKNPLEIKKERHLLDGLGFSTSRGWQAALYREGDKNVAYFSGIPERILEDAGLVETDKGPQSFKKKEKERFLEKLEKETNEGKRVVGLAYKEKEDESLNKKEGGFVFLGFLIIKDPLRLSAKGAIERCRSAGLRPVIVTGDYKNTAQKIGEEIGIETTEEEIMLGSQLEKISSDELAERVEKIKIYARAAPKDKIKIVEAWQKRGAVVAMTGDGVNDAAALKKADIGLALGSGTEVAKSAADLVLLNDSFEIIVAAVEQGRTILDNLRKAIGYVLADSLASIILVGSSIVFGWPLPILWSQILWNNVFEDTLPTIAFSFEPSEDRVMERDPEPPSAPILNTELRVLIFITGVVDQLFMLLVFWFMYFKMGKSIDYVRTMVFGVLCLDTAFVIYSFKNLKKNIWNIRFFNNLPLVASSVFVFIGFAAAIYIPPLQKILSTVPISFVDWLILLGAAIMSVSLIEITKWFFIAKKQLTQSGQ